MKKNPDQLRRTVLFLLGLNVGLRAGDEHYALRRDAPNSPSQLTFRRNEKGLRCLVYQEDSTTKTNDGGLNHMRKQRKLVWVYPSDNVLRCPVRIIDKYVSLLPPVTPKSKKTNFYLRRLEKLTPAQWYGEQVVGLNTLRSYMKEMAKEAKIDLFITNHSLRRSGTTRLFRGGVDRKLVKEFTGHSSDAVDEYQVTSDEQREMLSKIIAGKKEQTIPIPSLDLSVSDKQEGSNIGCWCNKQQLNLNAPEKIGQMITGILEQKKGMKAKIKLEIEFST